MTPSRTKPALSIAAIATLVEAVDPGLEPVVAELAEKHPRQLANRIFAQMPPAEIGMNGQPERAARCGCAG